MREEFERCAPWLQAAIDYNGGELGLDDIWQGIQTGEFVPVFKSHSAVIVEFQELPKKRLVNFVLAGGDLDQLRETEAEVCAWAKAHGFHSALIVGRRGWQKRLSGYKPVATVLEKEL